MTTETKTDKYQEKAREAGIKVRKVIDATTGEVTEIAEEVEARILENPVQATVAALAVGFIVGLLLGRR